VGCIYVATNKANGKRYVGKTSLSLLKRKIAHAKEVRGGSDYLFHRALRKYGVDGFVWEEVCSCFADDELNTSEMVYIRTLGTKSPAGYNLTDGGEGQTGAAESTRIKMSLAHKGKPKSEEHRRKLSVAHTGKVMPEGFREKMLRVHLGRKVSEETRKCMSEAARGRVITPEAKAKMSLAHKGKVLSAETRAKMSQSKMGNPGNKGKKLSAEHRKNIGLGLIGNKRSAETRAKMSESMRRTLRAKRLAAASQPSLFQEDMPC